MADWDGSKDAMFSLSQSLHVPTIIPDECVNGEELREWLVHNPKCRIHVPALCTA